MNYSIYQKILEESGDVDSAKRSRTAQNLSAYPVVTEITRHPKKALVALKDAWKRRNGSRLSHSNGK